MQRPASHSVRTLPSACAREDEKNVWAPAKIRFSISLKTPFLFEYFDGKSIKPFQAFTSPDSRALSVPWTGLERTHYCDIEKCNLKKTLPKTIWKCKLAKFLHVYLPIVKQAREEARGKVEQREEEQKIHARSCTILKWNEVIYNTFSRCKKNTIIP